jgi:hypothetical protein
MFEIVRPEKEACMKSGERLSKTQPETQNGTISPTKLDTKSPEQNAATRGCVLPVA